MQPISRIQGIALFSLVAVLLFALVWGGVNWAKGRSDHYAAQTSGTTDRQPQQSPQQAPQEQPQEPPKEQQTAPSQAQQSSPTPTQQPADQQKPEVAGAQTQTSAATSTVPSTGPEDVFLTVLTIIVAGFAAGKYFQQRHRLMSYR